MVPEKSKTGASGIPSGISSDEPGADPGWEIAPLPVDLLDFPLDYLVADHLRQRQAADLLQRIAQGEIPKAGIQSVIKFLTGDFALHVADEEVGLFPIMKQQCTPEDNIDALLNDLAAEHKEDEASIEKTIAILGVLSKGAELEPEQKDQLWRFAEHIRRHLAFENAILIPIARVRLNEAALKLLSGIMRERRVSVMRQ